MQWPLSHGGSVIANEEQQPPNSDTSNASHFYTKCIEVSMIWVLIWCNPRRHTFCFLSTAFIFVAISHLYFLLALYTRCSSSNNVCRSGECLVAEYRHWLRLISACEINHRIAQATIPDNNGGLMQTSWRIFSGHWLSSQSQNSLIGSSKVNVAMENVILIMFYFVWARPEGNLVIGSFWLWQLT